MFALSEVTFLNNSFTQFQSLKPWWDVLMDYLVLGMLTISLLSGTLLISVDNMTCLPLNNKINGTSAAMRKPPGMDLTIAEELPKANSHQLINLDYQQYVYINYVCYQRVLPWFLKYFPYFALVNSLLLMLSNNFWFKYPKTSSMTKHFLSILMKCFESPWTTKALSEIGQQRLPTRCPGQFSYPSPSPILDSKDRELGQALFEKIHRFRAHAENGSLIYKVYVGQTIFKVTTTLIVLVCTFNYVGSISFKYVCWPDKENKTGTFLCTHNTAFILQKLIASYLFLVFLCGAVGIYPLPWLLWQPLQKYSFMQIHKDHCFFDIAHAHNDFAFLLHMADQCNQLYTWWFAVFLSAMHANSTLDRSPTERCNLKNKLDVILLSHPQNKKKHL